MLRQIRKSLSSTVVFIMLALLIASFAFFGVGGIVTQQGAIVATVGDQKITMTEMRNAFDAEMQRIREQYGSTFTIEQALQFGVHRQVLNQLVLNAALDEEADRLGLLGSDEEVRNIIRQMEYFKDLSGNFSEVTYQQVLMQQNWNPKEFEDSLRVDIARQQLVDGITDTIMIPAILKNTLYDYRKESRKAAIVTIPASAITDVKEPTEEELKAYYDGAQTSFMSPEYRDLSFLILTPADFATADTFTEEQLRAEYDNRIDQYSVPAKRSFEVAILRTKEEADELIERVNSGEDFEAVALELTGLTADDLKGGPYSETEMIENYNARAADAVFKAAIGAVTEPLETLVSFQVFKVTSEVPGVEHPFEEVRSELSQALAEERGIEGLYEAVNTVDEELASGASMEEIAEAVGKPIIHLPKVTINAQDPNGVLAPQKRVYPYIQEAFQLHPDDELEFPQHPDREEFYMIRVNEVFDPAERPFEEVKGEVRQAIMAGRVMEKLAQRARDAETAANAGESLSSIAARVGGTSFDTEFYVRDRVFTQRELSSGIASLMFSLKKGEVGIEQNARGDGYVLVKLLEIKKQEPRPGDYEYAALTDRLSQELRNDLFFQFQAKLRKSLDVDINNDLLEGMFDPDYQLNGPSNALTQ